MYSVLVNSDVKKQICIALKGQQITTNK